LIPGFATPENNQSTSKIMDTLFQQYTKIHSHITGAEPADIILQISGDRYCLISADLFAFGGQFEEVKEALEKAIAQNQLLPNQE
jgi:hypothetical protein